MFCALTTYKKFGLNYWLIIDSEKGECETGWSDWRPAPFVIAYVYSLQWGQNPLPALKAYYASKRLDLRHILHILDSDISTVSANEFYYRYFQTKYYSCIKNHIKKMKWLGR